MASEMWGRGIEGRSYMFLRTAPAKVMFCCSFDSTEFAN